MPEQAPTTEDATMAPIQPLVRWRVHEYDNHDRSRFWYIVSAVIAAGLIVYAVVTANFLFAVIILMSGIILLLSSFKTPEEIEVMVLPSGILIEDDYYEFKKLQDFAVVYEPPDVKMLYINFKSALQPMIAIPLADTDPNVVREHLLPYCRENVHIEEERLTDMVRRLYKL